MTLNNVFSTNDAQKNELLEAIIYYIYIKIYVLLAKYNDRHFRLSECLIVRKTTR